MSPEINEELGYAVTDIVKPVPVWEVKTLAAARKKFKEVVSKDYEGLMLRNKDGVYLADADRTGSFMRSPDLVKMKQKHTAEFEVIGYTEGNRGKDKGAVIWVAQTSDEKQFNVTPKDMDYEERYEIFQDCEENFDDKYAGRMLTVEYEDLSKSGKPLRAKALVFRDYE